MKKPPPRKASRMRKPRDISGVYYAAWILGPTTSTNPKERYEAIGRVEGLIPKEARLMAKWLNQFADWAEARAK